MSKKPEFLTECVLLGSGLCVQRVESMEAYIDEQLTAGNDVTLVAIECDNDYMGIKEKYGREVTLCAKTYKGRGVSILIKVKDGPFNPSHYFDSNAYRYYNIQH